MIDAERSLGEIIKIKYDEAQCHRETMMDAAEALMKQIPMKPGIETATLLGGNRISETEDWAVRQSIYYVCPACKFFLGDVSDCENERYHYNYCPDCGQAIDWGEVESNE